MRTREVNQCAKITPHSRSHVLDVVRPADAQSGLRMFLHVRVIRGLEQEYRFEKILGRIIHCIEHLFILKITDFKYQNWQSSAESGEQSAFRRKL